MYLKKIYFLVIFAMLSGFQSLNGQDIKLYSQNRMPNGISQSASSTISWSSYIADDFSFASDVKVNTIILEGSQLDRNLRSTLVSINFYIVEAEALTKAPGKENVIYQSTANLDGISLKSDGYDQQFTIDLSNKSVNLQSNKKYWLIFTTNINAPLSAMTVWANYAGLNTAGTSIGRRYSNKTWTNLPVGMTFSIEGVTVLGTVESFESKTVILASTVVSQVLEVRLKSFKNITVYEAGGKTILTSDKASTNVSFLVPGVYLGVVTTKDGKRLSTKFIKK